MTNEEIEKYIEENLGKLKTEFEAKEMIVYKALVEIFKRYNYPESVIINESEYLEAVQEAKGVGDIELPDISTEADAGITLQHFGYLRRWYIPYEQGNEKKKELESREPIMISRYLTMGKERKIQLIATGIFKAQVFPKKDVLKRLSVLKAEAHWVKGGRKDGLSITFRQDIGIEEQLSEWLLDKYQVDIKRDKLEIKLFVNED